MATNIDKALNRAPQGLENTGAQGIEVEIMPDDFQDSQTDDAEEVEDPGFSDNLAEHMVSGDLVALASELSGLIDEDLMSRADWEKTYTDGLKLLGLNYEERMEPWEGACGVYHPMITEAIVKFQSEAVTETFPASGPVRTKILGKETPDKLQAAARVEHDMNYEMTDVMREYRPEHERMLWSLPATGSAFKKVYFDPNLGRQTSVFVGAEDIILPYGTTDMDTCFRLTHVMRKHPNEVKKLQKADFYCDVELSDNSKTNTDNIKQAKDKEAGVSDLNDTRLVLQEVHVELDLKGFEDVDDDGEPTGIALPYVVTLLKGMNTVLGIRRNWEENDALMRKRQHFVHYQYIPGFGAYGFGLFHLIGGFATSATSIMRQLIDAGTLSNLPGGFKTRGLRIKGDDTPIAPGEFRDVDVGSGSMRDNIMPLPYKEPSMVLAALLDKIVEEGRRFAATADLQISDMSAQAPVGTTLALLERQLKVMSAIQARMHYSMKQELRLLAAIIRDYTEDDYEYDPDGPVNRHAKKTDYAHVDIIPVSDPNAATMSQRVVQYQAVIQMAQMAPNIYDLPQLHRGMLTVLGVKNAEKLVPLPDDMKPKDPVTENMAVLKGTPVKAFQFQSHESHIQVHMSAMQDPIIMKLIGQNPQAPQIQAAMMTHVAEHVGFAYRQKIEQQLGAALPQLDDDESMPREVEFALSQMMAQAASQVLQQSQQTQAQQDAQQQSQDPLVQLQQEENKQKDRELDLREKKIVGDLAAKADEIQLKAEKQGADSDLRTAGMIVDGAKHVSTLRSQQAALPAPQSNQGDAA